MDARYEKIDFTHQALPSILCAALNVKEKKRKREKKEV